MSETRTLRRIYPAYGRALMQRRIGGHHPRETEAVLVALGFWPRVGNYPGAWPRACAVVVADEAPLARLELRMLAGANLTLSFATERLERAQELARRLADVHPVALWCCDYKARRVWDATYGPWATEGFVGHWPALCDDFARWAARSDEADARTA